MGGPGMTDHYWADPDYPCARCGMAFKAWASSRAPCVAGPPAAPDLTAEQARIWECVVSAAHGTQADGDADDQT